MANTLTGLIPTLYQALDMVARELVGFVPAVTRNSSAEQAAVNQTITFPVVPAATAADITPGVTAPDTGDQTIATATLAITKSRGVPIRWNGEEQKGVAHSGQLGNIMRDQFAQAMRTLVNEIEADLAALYVASSRAHGTAGTAPFGTAADFSDFAGVHQILDDNGCPQSGRQLVLGSAAIANLRGKQSVLFKANEAGTDALLREGIIGRVEGLDIHNSAQVKAHTRGTGASHLVNDATPPTVGDVAITLDTGTGTIVAGDVISLAGDANKYVVGTALAANVVTLNKPGLRVAADDDDALTYIAAYRANMAFHRSALQLVTRVPAMPEGGDSADDVMTITDPVSGLSFQVAVYRQRRQVHYEVSIAWGVKATKSEFIATLLG